MSDRKTSPRINIIRHAATTAGSPGLLATHEDGYVLILNPALSRQDELDTIEDLLRRIPSSTAR